MTLKEIVRIQPSFEQFAQMYLPVAEAAKAYPIRRQLREQAEFYNEELNKIFVQFNAVPNDGGNGVTQWTFPAETKDDANAALAELSKTEADIGKVTVNIGSNFQIQTSILDDISEAVTLNIIPEHTH